jgi:hypothetical protein
MPDFCPGIKAIRHHKYRHLNILTPHEYGLPTCSFRHSFCPDGLDATLDASPTNGSSTILILFDSTCPLIFWVLTKNLQCVTLWIYSSIRILVLYYSHNVNMTMEKVPDCRHSVIPRHDYSRVLCGLDTATWQVTDKLLGQSHHSNQFSSRGRREISQGGAHRRRSDQPDSQPKRWWWPSLAVRAPLPHWKESEDQLWPFPAEHCSGQYLKHRVFP